MPSVYAVGVYDHGMVAPPRRQALELTALAVILCLSATAGAAPAAERLMAAGLVACGLLLCVAVLCWRDERLGQGLLLACGLLALTRPPLPINQWAGLLAVSLPVWWTAGRRPFGLPASVFGLLTAAALLASGSRGGLTAAVAGLTVAWVVGARRPARAATLVVLAAVVTGLSLWRLELAGEPLWRHLLLEKRAQGLSLESALSGRPAIWQRSLWMLEDTAVRGVGPGGFGAAARCAYARGPEVEHAHQVVLQAAHDLGLPGALLWLWLVVQAALGLAASRRQSRNPEDRRLAAGLAGSLAAFFAFGIADALPLTSLPGLVIWPLLGLGLRHRPAGAWNRNLGRVLALLAVLVAAWPPAPDRAASRAVAALCHQPSRLATTLDELRTRGKSRPSLAWLEGLVAERLGRPDERDQAWNRLIDGAPGRLELVAAASLDAALASRASRRWPDRAAAWRWRARAHLALDEASGAITSWRRVVALSPTDGKAWLELAGLLAAADPMDLEALEAYAKACVHGDPGANACGRGGRLAERHGATLRAAALYRRSRWPPIRSRADQIGRPEAAD